MNTKDERVTIRLSADDLNQIDAIAEQNDESRAQVIRRAIKALLTVAAVLLTLTACGSTPEPSATVQASPVAQQQGVPEPSASDCKTALPYADPNSWEQRYNTSHDIQVALAILEAVPDPSEACTDADRESFQRASDLAAATHARLATATPS